MSEYSSLIQEYYKNPVNNYRMENAIISAHEWNPLCGDDITIYAEISPSITTDNNPLQNIISKRSYDGNVSMITQAAASFFSELIIWKTVQQALQLNEQFMIDEWFEVSPRRKRARAIAILATRNALHIWLKDNKYDTFEDVLHD